MREQNPNEKDQEFDYACACYKSALKAYESLCNDEHSGTSIAITKYILNNLIDGRPLTSIKGTDDEWRPAMRNNPGVTTYQCNRMPSLFKYVYEDGTVKYHDVNYVLCVNIKSPFTTHTFKLITNIIHDMSPITMPYSPRRPIKVFYEEFLTDKTNGDFDTVGVFYGIKEWYTVTKKIPINRFFREASEGEKGPWIEISKEEYEKRKTKRILT